MCTFSSTWCTKVLWLILQERLYQTRFLKDHSKVGENTKSRQLSNRIVGIRLQGKNKSVLDTKLDQNCCVKTSHTSLTYTYPSFFFLHHKPSYDNERNWVNAAGMCFCIASKICSCWLVNCLVSWVATAQIRAHLMAEHISSMNAVNKHIMKLTIQ